MGGGDSFPSAATVRTLLDSAKAYQSQGDLQRSAECYRQASEVVLKIGGGAGLTDDERYCLELQSQEFLQSAIALEGQIQARNAETVRVAPATVISTEASQENVGEQMPNEAQTEDGTPKTSVQTGACVVGATGGFCVGSIIGMPLFGTVAGGVFGGVAAARSDEYGERARKFGEYGASAIDKTSEFNRRYNVTGNLKVGAESLLYKAQEYDKQHNVVGRVADASSRLWNKAVQIEKEHKITEKVSEAAKATVDGAVKLDEKYKISSKVGEKISSTFASQGPPPNQQGPPS